MHNLSGRLVQDNQIGIGKDDGQGQVLRLTPRRCNDLRPDLDSFAALHRIPGADHLPFHQHVSRPNPVLQLPAGKLVEYLCQRNIQTLSCQILWHLALQRRIVQLPLRPICAAIYSRGTADSSMRVYSCCGFCKISIVSPCSTIRPSCMTAMRCAIQETTAMLCVMNR